MPSVIKDMRGRRFGRLWVPPTAKPKMRGGHAYWPVICECRTVKWVRGSKLRDGSTVSCSCWRADPDVRRAARGGRSLEELRESYESEPEEPDYENPPDFEEPANANVLVTKALSEEEMAELERDIFGIGSVPAPDGQPPEGTQSEKVKPPDPDEDDFLF